MSSVGPARGRSLAGLLGSLLVTATAATAGSLGSRNAELYRELARPVWAPPPELFAPAWTALYLLMAVAAWLVWRAPGNGRRRTALALYLAQLALNALWPWLFFHFRLGGWALVAIVVLVGLVAVTLARFWQVRALAGVLLLPYLGWVAYATALTAALWRANPHL